MQVVKVILFGVICMLWVSGCKQSAGSAEITGSKTTAAPSVAPAESKPDAAEPATLPTADLPPASASRKAYLSAGVWKPLMAIRASDPHFNDKYKDKRLKFKPDQTFDILENGQTLGSGKWSFDEDNMKIWLSSPIPTFNQSWKIMEKGFTMIWIGQTDDNKTGAQIRWDCEK